MQEREFSPVGSYEKIRFAGRIITATNKSPLELRESGGMRNDFYYRISSDVITLPTLRVRIAENHKELDSLVAYITEKIIGARDLDIINTVMTAIKKGVGYSYAWPGNVRELEQSIRRILLHGSYKGEFAASGTESYKGLIKNLQEGHLNAHSLLTQYCSLLYARYGSYEDVARIAGLDRRTVKKYIQ
jgi:transcriptional regulator with PAS, ATPase and Fis domain